MIKSIIVENDPKHYKLLQEKLKETTKSVEVLSVTTNISDAYAVILDLKPELVFLDIELDDGENGFDLLKKFEKPDFAVIFTTSFNTSNYAIAALRACALDFLPKPLILSELNDALNRMDKNHSVQQTQTLAKNISTEGERINTIWIHGIEGKMKLEVADILYCESDGVYTQFHLVTPIGKRQTITTSKGLKEWENILANSDVVRVHREYMVNKIYAKKYNVKLSGSAELTILNGIKIPVSKSRKAEVKGRLGL